MTITDLELKNFRNQKATKLHFNEGINLISGNNGTGKTSVLEAINTISTTKSFKAKKEIEIISYDEPFSSISLLKEEKGESKNLKILYEKSSDTRIKKTYIIDDVHKRASSFIGDLLTVFFTTDVVNGFNDKSSVRRKFFNQFLCQLDREYLSYLTTYEKIIKNKTRALKMIKDGADARLLTYWNNELIKVGAELIYRRGMFVKSIDSFLENHNAILDNKIKIKYTSKYFHTKNIEKIKQDLEEGIAMHTIYELDSCRALVGPHKDDYEVFFNGKDIKSFASRGEQKFSLSLLLYSIAQYIHDVKTNTPIILLDDLGAEMDKINLSSLLDLFINTHYQIILTSVYPDYFNKHIDLHIRFPYHS